jgi:hypothetical protein
MIGGTRMSDQKLQFLREPVPQWQRGSESSAFYRLATRL